MGARRLRQLTIFPQAIDYGSKTKDRFVGSFAALWWAAARTSRTG
jgi:hypothetical protein